MSSFDDREKGFEKKFVRDEEIQFKVNAKRNKYLGEWVAEKLGKKDQNKETYVQEVIKSDFAEPGDVLLAISGSGNSENVLRAVRYANEVGCVTVGFTGYEGGQLKDLVKHCIVVPSDHMGRIEDVHVILQHMICYYFMEQN